MLLISVSWYVNVLASQCLQRYIIRCVSVQHDMVVWEPPHGQFRFKYPWDLYKDVSRMCRHCMYSIVNMDGCLRSEMQCPVQFRQLLARPMTRLAEEAMKVCNTFDVLIET